MGIVTLAAFLQSFVGQTVIVELKVFLPPYFLLQFFSWKLN
jgi:hypothetical protein